MQVDKVEEVVRTCCRSCHIVNTQSIKLFPRRTEPKYDIYIFPRHTEPKYDICIFPRRTEPKYNICILSLIDFNLLIYIHLYIDIPIFREPHVADLSKANTSIIFINSHNAHCTLTYGVNSKQMMLRIFLENLENLENLEYSMPNAVFKIRM